MSATLEISKREQLANALQGVATPDTPQTQAAKQHLQELELPHFKAEDWKYTHTGHLTKTEWKAQPFEGDVNVSEYVPEGHDGPLLVFVDGFYRADLSEGFSSDKVEVSALGDATDLNAHYGQNANSKAHVFTALNTAHATGGAFIKIKKGTAYEKTILLLHISVTADTIAQPHHVIVAEENAQVNVVAHYTAAAEVNAFTNAVTEVTVGANAIVSLDQLQAERMQHNTILSEYVAQEKSSVFNITTTTLNGNFVRNGLYIEVNGEHCETNLSGLYLTRGHQLVDNHTVVDHKVPNCESNELYKGLLDDYSTGVFNGKVFVRQDAQKTNAFQSNGNIVLSDNATMNSKPELEIYADDVKCSHGSTTGQLDEDAIFYLRARGLSYDTARKMMVGAFAADVLEKVKNQPLREQIDILLANEFGWNF